MLGWSNEQKIEALIAHAAALHRRQSKLAGEVDSGKRAATAVSERLQSLASLDEYPSWDDLDWEARVNQIAALHDERDRILSASNRLAALNGELSLVIGSTHANEDRGERPAAQTGRRSRGARRPRARRSSGPITLCPAPGRLEIASRAGRPDCSASGVGGYRMARLRRLKPGAASSRTPAP